MITIADAIAELAPLFRVSTATEARRLLNEGADVNALSSIGLRPLHTAKNADVARVLLEAGADCAATTYETFFSMQPLHFQAIWGQADVCRVLLEAGADAEALDGFDLIPLELATNEETVQVFLDGGADPFALNRTGMPLCDTMNSIEAAEFLRQKQADLRAANLFVPRGCRHYTALHAAARYGDVAAVEKLLANGANVNARSTVMQATPLHWVGSVEAARLLLEAGAKSTALDSKGRFPAETAPSQEAAKLITAFFPHTPLPEGVPHLIDD